MSAIVGTAGWSIGAGEAAAFAAEGTSLERYAGRFAGVEINSSFHKPHRASTWQRWGDSVPDSFRFSVKIPKTITHQKKLADSSELVEAFLEEVKPLGEKLAILLVQLPPKLAYEEGLVAGFFDHLLPRAPARIACEPRHPSWFDEEADAVLARRGIARVAADPCVVPQAAVPGGSVTLRYWRLHGSPVMYRSSYDSGRLDAYAQAMRDELALGRECWCMFDNTASSAATANALALMERL